MKIATFGSCLSKRTAIQYQKLFGGELVGCVYHNRSDRFVQSVIQNKAPSLRAEDFEGITFEGGRGAIAKTMIFNQIEGGALGKHELPGAIGFLEAIKEPIDLILMDNYVDIVAKHCHFPGKEDAKIFLFPNDLGSAGAGLVRDDNYLEIDEALENWKVIIDWVRQQQRGMKIFFMNFPFSQHPNKVFSERTVEFERKFTTTRIKTIPLIDAHPIMVESNTHFTLPYYTMLAALIREKSGKAVKRGADQT